MLADLPSVWFVLWGNSFLAERVSLDEAAEGITGPVVRHRVEGLPEAPEPSSVAVTLGRLQASGARRLSLALPAPGDPLGLGGPAPFTSSAVACGEAVLVPDRALGLLPGPQSGDPGGASIHWQVVPDVVAAEPGDGLGPTETALRLTLIDAAAELTALDVAAGTDRPNRSSAPRRRPPPGTDGRAAHLLETADRMLDTVTAALADDGGAFTASQAIRRRDALRPLEHAARRAVVSACALSCAQPRRR